MTQTTRERISVLAVVGLAAIVAGLSGCGKKSGPTGPNAPLPQGKFLEGKKILLVIPDPGSATDAWRVSPEELERLSNYFMQKGAAVTGASISSKVPSGSKIQSVRALNEVKAADFDAVVFIGGAGAADYVTNDQAKTLVKDALDAPSVKALAAMTEAVDILAAAGIMQGKKATGMDTSLDALRQAGATVLDKEGMVRDGKIITAQSPAASLEVAREVSRLLIGQAQ